MAARRADARGGWLWVFGTAAGLRWVVDSGRMAFPESAGTRVQRMAAGDRAILYVSRGAFGNPTRDEARLVGIARVKDAPRRDARVVIGGSSYPWVVPIQLECWLGESEGPAMTTLVRKLNRVKRPDVWGVYFRNSPIELSARDFSVLERSTLSWSRRQR